MGPHLKSRLHRGWLACLSAALLLGAAVSFAGPEKVAFPAGYTEGRLYARVDRPGNKTVRDLYANAAAARAGQVGRPLPSGSVLSIRTASGTASGSTRGSPPTGSGSMWTPSPASSATSRSAKDYVFTLNELRFRGK
jgi:hypothetical protein